MCTNICFYDKEINISKTDIGVHSEIKKLFDRKFIVSIMETQ